MSDVFQLKGPDATAPCYATTCTASWQYDPRGRLTEEVNGAGTTVDYTLDVSRTGFRGDCCGPGSVWSGF